MTYMLMKNAHSSADRNAFKRERAKFRDVGHSSTAACRVASRNSQRDYLISRRGNTYASNFAGAERPLNFISPISPNRIARATTIR